MFFLLIRVKSDSYAKKVIDFFAYLCGCLRINYKKE